MDSLTGVASGDVRPQVQTGQPQPIWLISMVDPNRTFAPTTSVSGILVTGRVLLYALVDEFAAISQDAFIGLPGVAG